MISKACIGCTFCDSLYRHLLILLIIPIKMFVTNEWLHFNFFCLSFFFFFCLGNKILKKWACYLSPSWFKDHIY